MASSNSRSVPGHSDTHILVVGSEKEAEGHEDTQVSVSFSA